MAAAMAGAKAAVAREVVAMAAAMAGAKAAVTEVTEEEMVEVTALAMAEETSIGRRSWRPMREQEQRGQIGDSPMFSRMKTLTSAGIPCVAAGCSLRNEGAS